MRDIVIRVVIIRVSGTDIIIAYHLSYPSSTLIIATHTSIMSSYHASFLSCDLSRQPRRYRDVRVTRIVVVCALSANRCQVSRSAYRGTVGVRSPLCQLLTRAEYAATITTPHSAQQRHRSFIVAEYRWNAATM